MLSGDDVYSYMQSTSHGSNKHCRIKQTAGGGSIVSASYADRSSRDRTADSHHLPKRKEPVANAQQTQVLSRKITPTIGSFSALLCFLPDEAAAAATTSLLTQIKPKTNLPPPNRHLRPRLTHRGGDLHTRRSTPRQSVPASGGSAPPSSMGSDGEPAKGLLPYLQRADELQKHEPLVAYYCRLYAMEKGLRIPQKERTKTTNSILISLMNQLEKDKKTLTLGPDDNLHLEGFALNVFAKADKQDRAGRADINTAKTFYAASIFFEILNQFGELQPDIEQKQKYAIWKAAEIRKALKEGRKPEAGPPGGDKDEAPVSTTTVSQDMGRSQSFSAVQHGTEAPSPPVDKDFSRRDSFSALQQGNNVHRQNTEFNDHPSTQSPYNYSPPPPSQSQHPSPSQSYSSPSYQAPDYPPDFHKAPSNHSSPPYKSTDYPTNEVHKPPSNFSPPPYTRTDYPSNDGYNPHSSDKPDVSGYPQTYQPPPYTIEPQHTSQDYYSTEAPAAPYNYPHFQSYPSFQESTSPSVPTNQSSFYPASDGPAATSYSPASNPLAPTHYHSTADSAPQAPQVTPAAPPASQYKYDSSYQPAVEKIAEAHKAARFAVGALAFDDVSVAVDHLKRALDLLTNPSAETH